MHAHTHTRAEPTDMDETGALEQLLYIVHGWIWDNALLFSSCHADTHTQRCTQSKPVDCETSGSVREELDIPLFWHTSQHTHTHTQIQNTLNKQIHTHRHSVNKYSICTALHLNGHVKTHSFHPWKKRTYYCRQLFRHRRVVCSSSDICQPLSATTQPKEPPAAALRFQIL